MESSIATVVRSLSHEYRSAMRAPSHLIGQDAGGVEPDPASLGQDGDDVVDELVEALVRPKQELPLVDPPGGEHDGGHEDGGAFELLVAVAVVPGALAVVGMCDEGAAQVARGVDAEGGGVNRAAETIGTGAEGDAVVSVALGRHIELRHLHPRQGRAVGSEVDERHRVWIAGIAIAGHADEQPAPQQLGGNRIGAAARDKEEEARQERGFKQSGVAHGWLAISSWWR